MGSGMTEDATMWVDSVMVGCRAVDDDAGDDWYGKGGNAANES